MPHRKIQRYFRHGTLIQLRVFEAVVRHGSFTRAGEETHMAQPTVSLHVKKLTETVGVPLLEQRGKRIHVTEAGETVNAVCKRLLKTFSELDEALEDVRGLKSGCLRVATTTPGKCLMPPLLAAFVQQYPGIEVSLHVSSRRGVLERLDENMDDLYLLGVPPEGDDIVAYPVLPNPLIAVARADHPLARKKAIPFERFARETMLMREPGSGTRMAVERLFEENGITPAASMELGANETIKEAVIAGMGVALLYRYALGFEIDPEQLAVLDVEGLPRDGSWHFIHPAGKELSLVAQTFIAFAEKEVRRIFDARVACKGRAG